RAAVLPVDPVARRAARGADRQHPLLITKRARCPQPGAHRLPADASLQEAQEPLPERLRRQRRLDSKLKLRFHPQANRRVRISAKAGGRLIPERTDMITRRPEGASVKRWIHRYVPLTLRDRGCDTPAPILERLPGCSPPAKEGFC